MPVCGSDGPAFAFIEKSNTRYAVTTDISLGQDAFIQFDFSASCSVTNSCYCEHKGFASDVITGDGLISQFLFYSPCSCRAGVFSGPGFDLAAVGQRLSAHQP